MTISLNKDVIQKYNLTLEEAIMLLVVVNKLDMSKSIPGLLEKGFIGAGLTNNKPNGHYYSTRESEQVLDSIILDSDKVSGSELVLDRINNLVKILQDIYPKGQKEGTNKYWRCNKLDIKKKLQSFIKRYGEEYSDDQIINATQEYVSSFNGQYKFMRLLQYFIWKEEIKDGLKVTMSDLASFIENAGSITTGDDWTNEVR